MDPTRGSRFRQLALLLPLLRWLPLVAFAAGFGVHLVRTTRHHAAATASLDRDTRGAAGIAVWEPIDNATADGELGARRWFEADFPAAPAAETSGHKAPVDHAEVDSGNLTLAHDRSKPGVNYLEFYRASLPGRPGIECDNEWRFADAPHPRDTGVLAIRQSGDRRTVQFACAIRQYGGLAPGRDRWSIRFLHWAPTYPQRESRLALLHALEVPTRLGRGLLLGATLLALVVALRHLRRSPGRERTLGVAPYRRLRVTERAPTVPALGTAGRLVCGALALSAVGVTVWIGRAQRALDTQPLPTAPPPGTTAAPPGLPARTYCDGDCGAWSRCR